MLTLESLSKRFESTTAVDSLSLELGRGEFLSLLGPSGCGKTTSLRMIAGFESPSSGRILVNGRDVTHVSPRKRDTGMVFQNYALFPHLDVFENVAFGLKARGAAGAEISRKVAAALERVDLSGYERRPVQDLSGGQQQRVALARALAPEPPLLLLDEPLSNLDAALRERTRDELRTLLKAVGITAVFVTHDQEEAFALSDRIAVMNLGQLRQLGTPEELYRSPADAFVASFVGRANFLDARVVSRDGDLAEVMIGEHARWRVRLDSDGGAGSSSDGDVRVMVRPELLRLLPAGGDDPGGNPGADGNDDTALSGGSRGNGLPGWIVERRFAGSTTQYRVQLFGAPELLVSVPGHGPRLEGRVLVVAEEGVPLRAFPRSGL
ncbi:MAG: ABC transporter ATP-binding protein [Gemmatimonadota bacterium]|jgi:ABC-type Fe3+/spermidine/putrescine transport system ATPase subunit|nr:ABC transporter ATP-binding protein [Gemmatimonadota bacterium]